MDDEDIVWDCEECDGSGLTPEGETCEECHGEGVLDY